MTTAFSVIIPYTNSPLIIDILAALHAQTVDISMGEVFIVGPQSPVFQKTKNFITHIPVGNENGHASNKRNLGIQHASGEILLFLDEDCIPEANWLEVHLERQASGKCVVGGSVTFPPGNYIQLADNISAFHFMMEYSPPGYRNYLCTANLSVHHSVITDCGILLPDMSRAEDLEWTARFRRYGYQLYFEPGARVVHNPDRRTIKSFWRHWWDDAPNTLTVRLSYSDVLNTPRLANQRSMYLWGSPTIAAWATLRAFSRLKTIALYVHTLPLVYLSKLIWCWSAFKRFPKNININEKI